MVRAAAYRIRQNSFYVVTKATSETERLFEMRAFLKRRKLLLIFAALAASWVWGLIADINRRHLAELEENPDPVLRRAHLDKRRVGADRTKRPGLEDGVIEIYDRDILHTLDDPPTDVPPIVLKLPEKFRVFTSKGVVRDWEAYLMTYYPSFTSPRDPENVNYGLSCVGSCNGQILISIENVGRNAPGSANPKARFLTDLLVRGVLSDKYDWAIETQMALSNVLYTDLPPQAGFDTVIEKMLTSAKDARDLQPGTYKHIDRFYAHKNKKLDYFDFLVECHIPSGDNNFEQFMCRFNFLLECNPGAYVNVSGIRGEKLIDFFKMKLEIDRFVSNMIVKPECKKGS